MTSTATEACSSTCVRRAGGDLVRYWGRDHTIRSITNPRETAGGGGDAMVAGKKIKYLESLKKADVHRSRWRLEKGS